MWSLLFVSARLEFVRRKEGQQWKSQRASSRDQGGLSESPVLTILSALLVPCGGPAWTLLIRPQSNRDRGIIIPQSAQSQDPRPFVSDVNLNSKQISDWTLQVTAESLFLNIKSRKFPAKFTFPFFPQTPMSWLLIKYQTDTELNSSPWKDGRRRPHFKFDPVFH